MVTLAVALGIFTVLVFADYTPIVGARATEGVGVHETLVLAIRAAVSRRNSGTLATSGVWLGAASASGFSTKSGPGCARRSSAWVYR